MKSLLALVAMPLLVGAAVPPKLVYEFNLSVVRDGAVVATPRLLAVAGRAARFEVDDGKALAWSATLIATPDAQRAGMVDLAWTAQIVNRGTDGKQTVRRGAATVMLSDPGKATLPIGARNTASPTEIRVALASQKS